MHHVPLVRFCLALYGPHVLKKDVNMIQTNPVADSKCNIGVNTDHIKTCYLWNISGNVNRDIIMRFGVKQPIQWSKQNVSNLLKSCLKSMFKFLNIDGNMYGLIIFVVNLN